MKEDNRQINSNYEAALAYDLFGYLKITNIFTRSEIKEITNVYDQFHQDIKKIQIANEEARIPPTGSLLENNPKLIESIFSKSELMNTLRQVAGQDVQFAGSDSVHVYNDSIGIHRDTFYQFDFPKILVFLSDSSTNIRFRDSLEKQHGGNFLVLPGSHVINDLYTSRSSRLCHWPYAKSEQFSPLTPTFTFGKGKHTGNNMEKKQLIQCTQNKDKYHAFSKIQFNKGDVVIFSTRALHALYPLFQDGLQYSRKYPPLKLLGILFIEGYSKQHNETLGEALKRGVDNKELINYISTVYNLRLYNTTTDHSREAQQAIKNVSGRAMGLNRMINQLNNPTSKEAVCKANLIHDFYSNNASEIDKAAGTSKETINEFFLKLNKQAQESLDIETKHGPREFLESVLVTSSQKDNVAEEKEWQGIAKYLPMINNERVYLFYKMVVKLFHARKD